MKLSVNRNKQNKVIILLCFIGTLTIGCKQTNSEQQIEEFLPIGSVVQVDEIDVDIMIFGRSIEVEGHNGYYDYIGIPYPVGYSTLDQASIFQHEDIQRVIFKGYSSPEEEELNERLHEVLR